MVLPIAAAVQSVLPAPPARMNWRLVWADEFDAPYVDPSKWNILVGPRAGGFVTRRNVWLKDGFLHLGVGTVGDKMSTGALDSRGKTAFRFGYFEIRCKLPLRPGGHRAAFWLTSPAVNKVGAGGRDGTEVDIFEAPARKGQVDINLHWDGYGFDKKAFHYTAPRRLDYTKFHTFGLWWSPDRYRFYIDGDLVLTTNEGGVSQNPESVLVTDEVLETDKSFPANMAMIKAGAVDDFVVDYVRVFQLSGARSGGR